MKEQEISAFSFGTLVKRSTTLSITFNLKRTGQGGMISTKENLFLRKRKLLSFLETFMNKRWSSLKAIIQWLKNGKIVISSSSTAICSFAIRQKRRRNSYSTRVTLVWDMTRWGTPCRRISQSIPWKISEEDIIMC